MKNGNVDLGAVTQLAGFREIEESSMEAVKKDIALHSKKIAGLTKNVKMLHITLKLTHEREKSEKYDIRIKLIDDGRITNSHFIDRNLFVAINTALERLISELS